MGLRSVRKKKRRGKAAQVGYFLGGIAIGTAFGVYLWVLYNQLTTAFSQEDQLLPTRIYSDVTRIAPSQPRAYIANRLKNLGYTFNDSENTFRFNLHPIEYPPYLIPDRHPILETQSRTVLLHFDGEGSSALLQSIEMGNQEIPDLYLEPELVATLTRSGETRREIRNYLKFNEIPAPIWKAIIAIEDQHFLEHKGFDPRGIARAIWVNLKTRSLAQGGSTLTQQLVKNLMARRSKNVFRKINELFLSLLLEAKFDKEQILERYLNEVYLGQVGSLEIHGVAEGAEHFFGKKLADLNLAETALIAGLIRGPGFYSPYRYKERALERQRLVLKKMVETGQIAAEEAQLALKLPIRLVPPQNVATKAPFFTDYVKAELLRLLKDRLSELEMTQAGFRVYTTLDTYLNNEAQHAVSDGIASLETRWKLPTEERLEGALASVDHNTGNVRALVGGRNYSKSNFNRILNMKRQVGSTFKPLVYLAALEKGTDPTGISYGPGYPMNDAPWSLVYDRGKQTWSPRNYERNNLGWISLRTALSHSVNTITARLGYEVGIDQVIKTSKQLGVESNLPRVPSLSLGVAELSPLELLKVYANLANHGVENELRVIRGISLADGSNYARFVYHSKTVAPQAPIDLLTDMLQSVFAEGGTAQNAQKLGFERPAAGKTGTTSNYRDAWFAGYTPQLTTVVWVGLDQSSFKKAKVSLTGANSALPIWVSFMSKALAFEPPTPFPASPHLIDVQIDRHTGKVASSSCPTSQTLVEKYDREHEPKDKSCEPDWPVQKNETEEL